jgi:hypothetical protein
MSKPALQGEFSSASPVSIYVKTHCKITEDKKQPGVNGMRAPGKRLPRQI